MKSCDDDDQRCCVYIKLNKKHKYIEAGGYD